MGTGAPTTIILIHGLWMTGSEMSLLKRRLLPLGYVVRRFRYRTITQTLSHNTGRLAQLVGKLTREGREVHLVGHSLGGLIALHCLQHYPELEVSRVVCLGSPLVDAQAGRGFQRTPAGRMILGRTLPEAVYDRPLEAWFGKQQVGVVAGSGGIGIGRLINQLPQPNDGMVTLAETCLPGISDHLTVSTGHTGLLLSAEVAEQIDWFLRNGKFRREAA